MKRVVCYSLIFAFLGVPLSIKAGHCPPEKGDVFVYADWLYWTLRRTDLDYLNPFFQSAEEQADPELVGNGSCLKQPHLKFTNAYRVGVGYQSPCSLKTTVNYTHFTTKGSSFFENLSFGTATQGDNLNFLLPGVIIAFTDYDMDYSIIDAKVGYQLNHRCLGILTPYLGGRFAFIDEKSRTFYRSQEELDITDYSIHSKTNTKAYGLLAGFDYSNLFICERLGLFASASLAVMYGEVLAKTTQNTSGDTPISAANYDFAICEERALSGIDIALGLEGELVHMCNFTLSGRIGYEWHEWLCMVNFINITGIGLSAHARNHAGFALEGLFLRLVAKY